LTELVLQPKDTYHRCCRDHCEQAKAPNQHHDTNGNELGYQHETSYVYVAGQPYSSDSTGVFQSGGDLLFLGDINAKRLIRQAFGQSVATNKRFAGASQQAGNTNDTKLRFF
jgi:hypothetical protein